MSSLPTDSRVCVSIDVDWAPEEVIADTFALLEEAGVKATVFATHPSAVVAEMGRHGHEIGLHPNFTGAPPQEVLSALRDLFPDAVGVRSHRLVMDSAILEAFHEAGLAYDSNIFAFLVPELAGYRYHTGMWRFPIYWGDLTAARLGGPWEPSAMSMRSGALHTFIFHCVHLFLNTGAPEHYAVARPHYHDPVALRSLRRPASGPDHRPGSRDAFLRLVEAARGVTVRLKDCVPTAR